jgi:hypothetical protein
VDWLTMLIFCGGLTLFYAVLSLLIQGNYAKTPGFEFDSEGSKWSLENIARISNNEFVSFRSDAL